RRRPRGRRARVRATRRADRYDPAAAATVGRDTARVPPAYRDSGRARDIRVDMDWQRPRAESARENHRARWRERWSRGHPRAAGAVTPARAGQILAARRGTERPDAPARLAGIRLEFADPGSDGPRSAP